MMREWIIVIAVIFILLPNPVSSVRIDAASCEQSDVQAAIDSAVSGDTVSVPPEECVWSSGIQIPSSKSIILTGAGREHTVIIRDPPGTAVSLQESSSRITGFEFINGSLSANGHGWRIDHCGIIWVSGSSTGVSVRGGTTEHPTGLIDHNTFFNSRVVIAGSAAMLYEGDRQHELWNKNYSLGSSENVVFIEDCDFTKEGHGNSIDANYGGRYVFRYNNVTDSTTEAHSVQGNNRATISWEIYNNTFHEVNRAMWVPFFQRGGTGVIFNNTIVGGWTLKAIAIDNVRSCSNSSISGYCDGSSPWDGNEPIDSGGNGNHDGSDNSATLTDSSQSWIDDDLIGITVYNLDDGSMGTITANTGTTLTATLSGGTDNDWDPGDSFKITDGYPCRDQIGRSTDQWLWSDENPYPPQVLDPAYAWNNKHGENDVLFYEHNCEQCKRHLKEGTDYYNNLEKPGYVPYTYPHPLTLAVCGDYVIEGSEECDDGNAIGGDGCDSYCQNEPVCGNDLIEPGEACDGNNVSGYDCLTLAAGYTSGTVSCKADCRGYDISLCIPGGVITAVSCELADVQAAIDSAQNGDTVYIPEGNCTWNSEARIIDTNIVIEGAGIDVTNISDSQSGYNTELFYFSGEKPFRITGISLLETNDEGIIADGNNNWRIHDSRFQGGYAGVMTSGPTSYGVIDHCIFDGPEVIAFSDEDAAWELPLSLGTANAMYAEDNIFNEHESCGNDAVDGRSGGRIVFRYNTLNNEMLHIHGTDGGGSRGTHSIEFYGNIMIDTGPLNCYRFGDIRGGTGVIWNNTALGDWGPLYAAQNCGVSRNCSVDKDCNNVYPCLDQVGRTTDHDGNGVLDLVPLFVWENYENTERKYIEVANGTYPDMNFFIKEGRDFFNDAVTYEPVNGIYSASYTDDDGSTKQWSYKPYPYPHPLTMLESSQQTYHRSDTNKNGCIETGEMVAFMDRWKISSQDVGMVELMESIGLWKSGVGCS